MVDAYDPGLVKAAGGRPGSGILCHEGVYLVPRPSFETPAEIRRGTHPGRRRRRHVDRAGDDPRTAGRRHEGMALSLVTNYAAGLAPDARPRPDAGRGQRDVGQAGWQLVRHFLSGYE
jgi:hypothetical protein